jgi:undecaprenyl-diphosphatase
MQRAERSLPLSHALALGLLQGPAELLPISSSAHTALLARALRWPYGELDGSRRKSFELALHGGAGLALALAMRRQLREQAGRLDLRRAGALALALAPPALAGRALRGPIERRLGGPRSIAAGLLAGAAAMALADARPRGGERRCEEVGPLDGAALGAAQALALIPGVSRSGATLTAARARGFGRAGAQSLSFTIALPLLIGGAGADALEARDAGARGTELAGAAAAFCSTLISARVLSPSRERALLPFAIYRVLLAAALARGPRRKAMKALVAR